MVKDKIERIMDARRRLAQQAPDPTLVMAGSLMKRMIRCNKPGCRHCEKGKGEGHGPIWILSVSAGSRRVRQIPVPAHLNLKTAVRSSVSQSACASENLAPEETAERGAQNELPS